MSTRYKISNLRGEVLFYLLIESNPLISDVLYANLTSINNVSINSEIVDSTNDLTAVYQYLIENSGFNDLQELKNISIKIEKASFSNEQRDEINKQIAIVKQQLLKNGNT